MTFDEALITLLDLLRTTAPPGIVNQFAHGDPALDHPDGPARRRQNLALYLRRFQDARYLLCGEAAGYNGARFSGITLCDEEKLAGPRPLPWAGATNGYRRGSRDDHPLHRELSASVVWKALGDRTDVALWNTVPWHPAGPNGPLTNRPPTPAERAAGQLLLRHVLTHLFPGARPLAVGRVAQTALHGLGYDAPYLRHPAQGGAALFRQGLAEHCPPSSP